MMPARPLSVSSRWIAWVIGLALLAAALPASSQTRNPNTFPVPARFWNFSSAPTYSELARLRPLIEAPPANQQGMGPSGPAAFRSAFVFAVNLGSLGRSFIVTPNCHAQNCTATVYVPSGRTYRQVLTAGGGLGPVPSGSSVPDLIGYWTSGAGSGTTSYYHYDGNQFVPAAPPSSGAVIPQPVKSHELPDDPALPSQYASLRPVLERVLATLSPAQQSIAIAGAQVLDISGYLGREFFVRFGNCSAQGNCPIVLLLRTPDGSYQPVLHGTGNRISTSTANDDYDSSTIVITKRRPGNAEELVRFRQLPAWPMAAASPAGYCAAGGVIPGGPECTTWHRADCELVNGSTLTPVYCANTKPIAGTEPADLTRIQFAVGDGSGTAWAVSVSDGLTPSSLLRWNSGDWTPVSPPHPGYVIGQLSPRPTPDGDVQVLWYKPVRGGFPQQAILCSYRGNQTSNCNFDAPVGWQFLPPTKSGPQFFQGVPSPTSSIAVRSANADFQRTFSLRNAQFTTTPGTAHNLAIPLHATRDDHGGIWFWTAWLWPIQSRMSRVTLLNGFVIYRDGRFVYHATLPGLPPSQVSVLAVWDKTDLLAAVPGVGPFLIDTQTLHASPMTVPQGADLRHILDVLAEGKVRYLIASTAPHATVIDGVSAQRKNDLWRWNDGRWQLLVSGLDPVIDDLLPSPRAIATIAGGTWIGTSDGMWFFPGGKGAPRLIDGREGLATGEVDALIRLNNDELLAMEYATANNPATVAVSPRSLLNAEPPPGLKLLAAGTVLEPGPNHHLWTESQGTLSEWDGSSWLTHPLPGGISRFPFSGVMPDTHGNIWLLPANCRFGPIGVYNPKTQTWRIAEDYRFALMRAGYTVEAIHDRFNLQPVNGPERQIVFRGICQAVNYFDGQRWHIWNVGSIPGGDHAILQSPPSFAANGHLTINAGPNQTWQWTGTDWQQLPYRPRPPFPTLPPPLTTAPPETCPTTWPSSLVTDRLGREWWTTEGNLYEGTAQQCRMVLSAAAAQPFRDGRKLDAAYVDPDGGVFLETSGAAGQQFVQLAPMPSAPGFETTRP